MTSEASLVLPPKKRELVAVQILGEPLRSPCQALSQRFPHRAYNKRISPANERSTTMRKLSVSILAAAALVVAAFGGVAAAAPSPSHPAERASLDRNTSARDRSEHHGRAESRSRDRGSHDRSGHERQHAETHRG
jgi:hypothetical protein